MIEPKSGAFQRSSAWRRTEYSRNLSAWLSKSVPFPNSNKKEPGQIIGSPLPGYRDDILSLLVQKVGFRFNESDLSPVLRRRVSELVEMRQGIDARQAAIPNEQSHIISLKSKKENNTIYLAILIIVGAILTILIVGIAFFVWAYLVYRQRQKINAQILQANNQTGILTAEINNLNYTFNQRIHQVTNEIQGELSTAYIMKPRGLEQTQAFESRTVQTMTAPLASQPMIAPQVQVSPPPSDYPSENPPLTGMIKCAYCERFFPQTSFKCPHCGADRGR